MITIPAAAVAGLIIGIAAWEVPGAAFVSLILLIACIWSGENFGVWLVAWVVLCVCYLLAFGLVGWRFRRAG